jgi:cytochrome c oxidase accessory protein FixG
VISYDAKRGEPRKQRSKQHDKQPAQTPEGDCIDCKICVQVCPTNIDIRDGLQYECIGCAACIDACNAVMQKIGRPSGLIRYTSDNALAQLPTTNEQNFLIRKVFRPRMLVYGAIWLALVITLLLTLQLRSHTAVDIIRDRQTFYQLVAPGTVDNIYTLRIMNKLQVPQQYTLEVADHPNAQLLHQPKTIDVPAGEVFDLPMRLRLPLAKSATAPKGAQPITFLLKTTRTNHATESDTLFWYPR